MPIAVMVRSADTAQQFVLADSAGIGRSAENDLVLEAPNISRRHARIERANGGFQLTDLGSANGTHYSGHEIEPRVPVHLPTGSRFSIGPYEIELLAVAAPVSTADPAALSGVIGLSSGIGQETAILAREPRLVIVSSLGRTEMPLRSGTELFAGRAPGNDIVIDTDVVSRRHFVLRRQMGGFEIEDLGSRNGLRLGSERIQKHFLQDGDIVDIGGEVQIQYLDRPPELSAAAPAGRSVDLKQAGEAFIGRAQSCDIRLDHPTVSLRHARVVTSNGVRTIEDLGSTNGTFVNGERIYPGESRRVASGDEVRVGPILLTLSADAIEHRDDSTHITLDAIGLRQQVSETVNLLQNISFVIRPQEFVAVVGGSGAGKSTLLGALSGLRPASDGAILLNGTPLYENFPAFRAHLGYVPQDDILHKELPVQRALEYAAALRLPDDTTAEERTARVADVMKTLGLDQRKDVPILRLSGGQRKRVSIGAELLTKPGLFFLDEATSGLDPGTEAQLMRLLRSLADDGHTIVLITHATKNVMLCDQVAFLARGGYLAYYGPPDQALTYFGVQDFDGIYERLESEGTPEGWGAEFARSAIFQEFVRDRLIGDGIPMQGPVPTLPPQRPAPANLRPRKSNPISQTWILSRRYFDIIRRDRIYLLLMFVLAPLLGAVAFVAPADVLSYETGSATDAMLPLFLSVLFPFIVGALLSVREIVKEGPIYQRERTVSLSVAPYVLSKVLVALMFAIYQGFAIFLIAALWRDVPEATGINYVQMYVTVVLAIMSGVLWGLFISALTPREEQAMLLAVGPIMMQVVFSGGLIPLEKMGIFGTVMGAITSTHWAFRALTTASGLSLDGCSVEDLTNCQLPGFGALDPASAEARIEFTSVNDAFGAIFGAEVWVCWVAMVAIIFVLGLLIIGLQKRKDTL